MVDDAPVVSPLGDDLLRVTDVAKIFNVKPYTVRGWIKDGKLRAFQIDSGTYRVYKSEVRRFANSKYGDQS